MPITVGVNSYVTLDEANEYLAYQLGKETWEILNESQKECYLITAARNIDSLLLNGSKADPKQAMAFPRFNDAEADIEPVKIAQILEALALSDKEKFKRRTLQEQGIKSISLGSSSESYSEKAVQPLLSQKALNLLRPWLCGGADTV